MVEASTALAILENVSLPIKNIVGILYTLVGGVFGLYLILLFMRFKEYRTLRKILTDIRHDLRSLNMHLGN